MSKVALIVDDNDIGAITVTVEPLDDNDTDSPAHRIACMIHQAVPGILQPLVDAGNLAPPVELTDITH